MRSVALEDQSLLGRLVLSKCKLNQGLNDLQASRSEEASTHLCVQYSVPHGLMLVIALLGLIIDHNT